MGFPYAAVEPTDVVLPEAPDLTAEESSRLSVSRRAVLAAPAFVAEHYAEKFAALAVARHCGLSRFQFSRSFHSVFGITFREYLLRFRIREACRRLRAGAGPVTGIAYGVGFHDGSYFARMFRRYTGELPSQYARRHEQATDT
jgi:AraC-like DNA-binding protein